VRTSKRNVNVEGLPPDALAKKNEKLCARPNWSFESLIELMDERQVKEAGLKKDISQVFLNPGVNELLRESITSPVPFTWNFIWNPNLYT
jgi:hypothetical protein